MFCPKCGEKNKENANFCVKCGENFKEKTTKAAKTTKTAKDAGTSKITTEDVKELTKEVTREMTSEASSIVRELVSKPVDTLKKYGEEKRFNLALCLVGLMSLLVGLFLIALIKNIYTGVMSGIMGSLFGMGSTSSMYGMSSAVDIPYFKTFIIAALVTFALSFVFVGILYFVCNVVFKGTESFKKMYVIYAIISMVVSASLLVSLVLVFLNIGLASIVLALGLSLSAFYTYYMIRLVGPKNENMHGYVYVMTTALFYLAIYILTKVFM